MKKFITLFYLFVLILLSSCAHESDSFSGIKELEPTAEVAIRTRTNLGEPPSRLPVHVYAFNTAGQCVTYQMLTNPGEQLSLTLPAGNYTISALAGASSDRYIIPDLSNAMTTSPLELIDPEGKHAELEVGRANITLNDGEHKELALTVSHVVAQVKFSVFDLPENITEVKMSLQPLQGVLRMDGLFDDTQYGSASVPLTKSPTENRWTTDSVFVFPSKGDVTINIVLTDTDGDRNYAYNTSFEINANYKYDIAATYKSGSPDINGIITGSDWEGEEQYEFIFGGNSYRAGDFYRNCYILHVEKGTDNNATLFLLSPKQWECTDTIGVKKLKAEYEQFGITNWEILSIEEATKLNELCTQKLEQLNNLFKEHGNTPFREDDSKYFYMPENGNIRAFQLKGTFSTQTITKGNKYMLRFLKKQQIKY
ncbi:MAG: FimB/Mfa2 family fimbrial subunit [Tannerellaceae bacterium]|jgi:hypothetical protein|nr:FimB/Mfa2 family fimbrial subunit [Tannerellaceae bacterium]